MWKPIGMLFFTGAVYALTLGIVAPSTVFYAGKLNNVHYLLWSNNVAWIIVSFVCIKHSGNTLEVKMPNPTKEQIDEAKWSICKGIQPRDGEMVITCKLLLDSQAENTALRSLVRRMREALKGNSLWPAEVDALCAEADKALQPNN